jgi:hypothetical protein
VAATDTPVSPGTRQEGPIDQLREGTGHVTGDEELGRLASDWESDAFAPSRAGFKSPFLTVC